MQKIVVVSDSHGSKSELEEMLSIENPNMLVFLGDGLRDLENIHIPTKAVSGNCDLFSFEPIVDIFNINNKKCLITHGQKYFVKNGLYALIKEAKELNVNIAMFGHTHSVYNEIIDDILFLNPGSFKNGSYIVLKVDEKGSIIPEFKRI